MISKKIKIIFAIFCSLGIIVGALAYGSASLSTKSVFQILWNTILSREFFEVTWTNSMEIVVCYLRLPRILMAFVTGAALSIVGVFMQTMTKNTLAEPYILGISSGASAGAVTVIVLAANYVLLQKISIEQGAFLGSLLSLLILFLLTSQHFFKGTQLILVGVGISAFFAAVTTLIIYNSRNNSQMVTAMFWMMGSLSAVSWESLLYPSIFTTILLIFGILFSHELDILLLGEEEARILGVATRFLKYFFLCFSSLVISMIVSVTGIIGFVGLIIPHIARKLIGYQHRNLLLFSTFLGGSFLVVVDSFARTYFSPEEIPIGVVTAFIGSPLFLYIIRKKKQGDGKRC